MLTLQEKLALAMTSFETAGELAAAAGVSRRTMNRWLREGEENGVKAIPAYAKDAIDTVFSVHRDLVAAQAKADGIPYSKSRPIFLERKQLNTGAPGDRVIGSSTEFIRSALRMDILRDQQKSQRYLGVSVRSVIDLQRYFRLDSEGNVKQKYLKSRKTPNQQAAENLSAFVHREKREKGRIIDRHEPFPLYTKYEDISPLRAVDDVRGVVSVEKQLRQKHEPATGAPGTVSADQYLFQLLPARYVEKTRKSKPKPATTVRNRRGAKAPSRK